MSVDPQEVPRRQVVCGLLLLGVLGPAAGALAGCDDGSAAGGGPSSSGGATGSATPTGSAGAAPPPSTSAGSTGASPAPSTGAPGDPGVAAVADVPVGGGILVTTDSGRLLLVQPTAGTVKAYNPRCPHTGTTVDPPEAGVITCPAHGSRFRAADGAVTRGPARKGLTEVPVTVRGGRVLLG